MRQIFHMNLLLARLHCRGDHHLKSQWILQGTARTGKQQLTTLALDLFN